MKKIIFILLLMPLMLTAQKSYELECDSATFYKSMDILNSWMGKVEIPVNRGFADTVNKIAGAPLGSPWCSSFQYAAFKLAGTPPYPQTALANFPYFYAVKHGKKVDLVNPYGALIIWYLPGKNTGHIERIYKVLQGGFVATYAGNTSVINVREGGRAAKMIRHTKRNLGRMIIRPLIGFKIKVKK